MLSNYCSWDLISPLNFVWFENAACIPCAIDNNFELRLHCYSRPQQLFIDPWPFSDPLSTPWLFIDPLDGPIDPWGSISTTLRTTVLRSCFILQRKLHYMHYLSWFFHFHVNCRVTATRSVWKFCNFVLRSYLLITSTNISSNIYHRLSLCFACSHWIFQLKTYYEHLTTKKHTTVILKT